MNFQSILAPLEHLLAYILNLSFSISNNYGIAIILLSLFVNLLLLPIYILAEKLQEKEISIRQAMQAKLDEIKLCFQGQERFMMIQTLYRIHNYHPIMGLRSIGSLLIQIPFFFAAYHFLKSYDGFANVSFLFVNSLDKPDALIPFGRYAIHILPLLMTIINIASAQVYTLRKNPQALLSTWGMAAVFLLLLYTSPSSLVLYWTCNNIFSLLKNLVLRKLEHLNKPTKLNLSSSKASNSANARTILSNKLLLFFSREIKPIKTILALWALSIYCALAFVLTPSNRLRGTIPNTLVHSASVLLIISALLLLAAQYYNFRHGGTKIRRAMQFYIVKLCLHALSTLVGLGIILQYVFIPEFALSIDSVKLKYMGIAFLVLPNTLYLSFFLRYVLAYAKAHTNQLKSAVQAKQNANAFLAKHDGILIYIAASLSICLLLYFALPADIYTSAPLEVGLAFSSIAKLNMLYAVSYLCILLALYKIVPKSLRRLLCYILVCLASILFLYAILLPIDLGRMDNFSLIFPQKIVPSFGQYVVEALVLLSLLFLLYRLLQTQSTKILGLLLICNAILIVFFARPSVWHNYFGESAGTYASDFTNTPSDMANNSASAIPHNAGELLSFSRTQDNVVVLLLDMANGGYMQRALEDNPNLSALYSDFTWYPNTLSISTFTTPSKPSIMAGWQYTPEAIANIEGENLAQKVIQSYNVMLDTFLQHQYKIALTGVSYYGGDFVQCQVLETRNIACLDYWDDSYIGYWLANNGDGTQTIADTTLPKSKRIALLVSAGLLRAVPLAFKQAVYDKGNWNLFVSEFKNQEGYNWAIKDWAFLDSMSNLSTVYQAEDSAHNNTETHDSPTFKFIHSNVTHRPYALDANCALRNDVFPDEQTHNDYEGDSAYYSFRCTLESLARWIDWLKVHNIYDNTKIIMLSDHGNDFADDPMNINTISPSMMGREDSDIFSRAHVLLMVKDFARNAAGANKQQVPLQIDQRLMSNTDAASIMFFSIPNYRAANRSMYDDTLDRTKLQLADSYDRTLPIYHTAFYNWIDLVKEPSAFRIIDKYEVQHNIFEPENWHKVIGEPPTKNKNTSKHEDAQQKRNP